MSLRATHRDASQATVVDLSGRITLGEGSALLRKTVRGLLDEQRTRIVLNLADVDYIDSSGIGELVSAYTTAKSRGGELKLLHLTKKVHDLLQLTKLYTVFDVYTDESTALSSFQ
ncbi:MAG: STAS domain-containing protein [Candidatus Acidiferrum sp.]